MTFQNPTPVVVGLVPVRTEGYQGLLVIRRGIEPGCGRLALPGGYLEIERWQDGLSREVYEETGVGVAPSGWTPFSFASSDPYPNHLLVFASCPHVYMREIPPFRMNSEVQEIGVVFRSEGLEEQVIFPLHMTQMRRWLEMQWKDNGDPPPSGFQSLPIAA